MLDAEMPDGPGPRKSLSGPRVHQRHSAPARVSARETLRAATDDTHMRMHAHSGYRTLASGVIQADAYRRLLARSYGFYLPIEVQLARGLVRSSRLEADLVSLGMTAQSVDALPLCRDLSPLDSVPQALGAAYVLEGAALGGLAMARALISKAHGSAPPTAFLLGDGENGGPRWRNFIVELEAGLLGVFELEVAAQSARATFVAFETWMAAWDR